MASSQSRRAAAGDLVKGPVGLGYLRLPAMTLPAQAVADAIAVMEAFATIHGYVLGEVFVDDEPLRRLAWAQLLDAVRAVRPVAVLVPDVLRLRMSRTELLALQARLRHVTNAPLVPARPHLPTAELTGPIARPLHERPLPRSRHARGELVRARVFRSSWRSSWIRRTSITSPPGPGYPGRERITIHHDQRFAR